MKHYLAMALSAAFAAVAAISSQAQGQTTLSRDDINRISRAVVRVVAMERDQEIASGSGTIIERTGRIYTNRHVVEDAENFQIEILDDLNEQPVPRYMRRRESMLS
jgi:S1-C subfamily serine protease